MDKILNNEKDTKELAVFIAKKVSELDIKILLLHGDLGSGKTTFTSLLVEELGFKDRVQSPTFVLLREYTKVTDTDIKKILHYDLYRLTEKAEVEDIGFFESISGDDRLTIIEWPELIENSLQKLKVLNLYFDYVDEFARKVRIDGL